MVLGSGIRDPGSGKNPFRIPDPGSRGQKGTGSGSATLLSLPPQNTVEAKDPGDHVACKHELLCLHENTVKSWNGKERI
jgi:hypothetical protein